MAVNAAIAAILNFMSIFQLKYCAALHGLFWGDCTVFSGVVNVSLK